MAFINDILGGLSSRSLQDLQIILVQFHFKISKRRKGWYSNWGRKKDLLALYNVAGPRYKT